MQHFNLRLTLFFVFIFICDMANGQILTTCKKIQYMMPNDTTLYLYKVLIMNNDSISYLSWFDDHKISKESREQIKSDHFLFRKKGDFNLFNFLYEDMANDSTNINKEFYKEFLIKEIHPKENFTYFIFSSVTDENKILNKIAIVTNLILSIPLEQRVGTAWLYKGKECIIFDTGVNLSDK